MFNIKFVDFKIGELSVDQFMIERSRDLGKERSIHLKFKIEDLKLTLLKFLF